MAELLFKKGLYENLPNTYKEGTVYVTTDEKSMYLDISDSARIRIQGTVHAYANLTDFTTENRPPYSTDVIYFIADKNALVRWDGSKWIQLNQTADSVSAAVTQLTEAINKNKDDIAALSTTVTALGTTIGVPADAEAGTEATGLIKDIATNAAGVAANAGAIEGLDSRLGTAEGKIEDLEEAVGAPAEGETPASGLFADVATNASNINALNTKAGELEDAIGANTVLIGGNTTAIEGLGTRIGALETTVDTATTGLKDRVTALESTSATKTELTTAVGGLNTSITGVSNRVTALETNIPTTYATKAELQTVSGDLDKAEETIASHTETLSGLNARFAAKSIEETVAGHTTSLQSLNTTVGQHTTTIGEHSATLTQHGTAIQGLKDAIGTVDTEGSILKDIATLKTTKLDKSEFNTYKSDTATTLGSINTNITTNANNITALSEVVGKEAVVDAEGKVTEEATGLIADVRELEEQVATNTDDISKQGNRIAGLEALLGQGGTGENTFADRLADVEDLADKNAEDITTLNTTTEEQGKAIAALQQVVDAVDDTYATKAELKAVEDQVKTKAAQSDLEALQNLVGKTAEDGLRKDIATNAENISALNTSLGAPTKENSGSAFVEIEANAADISDLKGRMTTAEGEIDTLQEQLDASKEGSLAKQVADLKTTVGDSTDGLVTKVSALETAVKTNIPATYATKDELEEAAETLDGKIDSRIKAVNAMRYKGTVKSFAELEALINVSIGDTYVIGETFIVETGADPVVYHAGDLVVASGTEGNVDSEGNAYIEGDVTWSIVDTGYNSALENKLDTTFDEGTVTVALKSHTGVTLDSFSLVGGSGVTLTMDENKKVTVATTWGEF